ncbi:hypothetical protein D8674_020880 [Pyrus ussuriensis x Pyrus communis]|uniref:Uncharacterized protein n=1 Tax=Pyrus ussuriensis x Pyrus communis TaxID=2448454 RepID=A0A5N5HM88_9ROSA|nr:hypothetical protein D8674_020880 [Pyrus ussuriensis x Pyrus communis]
MLVPIIAFIDFSSPIVQAFPFGDAFQSTVSHHQPCSSELAVLSLPQSDQHAAAILAAAQMQFQRQGSDGGGAAVPELPKIKM